MSLFKYTFISGNDKNLLYVKDNRIYGVDTSSKKREANQLLTNNLFASNGYAYDSILSYAGQYSDDKKFFFYKENDFENEYTLYYKNAKKMSAEGEFIDSNVSYYEITKKNKVIYYKSNDMYLYDVAKKQKLKIDNDVQKYALDPDEEKILWFVSDSDGLLSVYRQNLKEEQEKQKRERNIREVVSWTEDLKRIYYIKDDKFYVMAQNGNQTTLATDVENVYMVDESVDNLTFYFTSKETDKVHKASQYVLDDMEEADSKLESPAIEDYQTKRLDMWGYMETVTDDAYYDALDMYEQKLSRDELREELESEEMDISFTTLYYVKDGEKKSVSDTFNYFTEYEEKAEAKLFTSYNIEQIAKLKLSEIESVYGVRNYVDNIYTNDALTTKMILGDKVVDLKGIVSDSKYYKKGKLIYFLEDNGKSEFEDDYDYESEAYELKVVSYDNETFGEIKTIDKNVNNIECKGYYGDSYIAFNTIGANMYDIADIYYIKDAKDGFGDLYRNGGRIQADVKTYSVVPVPDSEAILYFIDVNVEKSYGTLMCTKGNDAFRVADDVTVFQAASEKEIALLVDFNQQGEKSDLKYYDGSKNLISVDNEVSSLIYTKDCSVCSLYQ